MSNLTEFLMTGCYWIGLWAVCLFLLTTILHWSFLLIDRRALSDHPAMRDRFWKLNLLTTALFALLAPVAFALLTTQQQASQSVFIKEAPSVAETMLHEKTDWSSEQKRPREGLLSEPQPAAKQPAMLFPRAVFSQTDSTNGENEAFFPDDFAQLPKPENQILPESTSPRPLFPMFQTDPLVESNPSADAAGVEPLAEQVVSIETKPEVASQLNSPVQSLTPVVSPQSFYLQVRTLFSVLGGLVLFAILVMGARVHATTLWFRLFLSRAEKLNVADVPTPENGASKQFAKMTFCHSSRFSVPLVFGWRKPTILIPDWLLAPDQHETYRCVVAHELAHVERGDLWWQTLSEWLKTLLWFQPLQRKVTKRWKLASEQCCDLQSVRWGINPIHAADSLVTAFEHISGRVPQLSLASCDGPSLQPRVTMLLNAETQTNLLSRSRQSMMLLLLLTLCIVWSLVICWPVIAHAVGLFLPQQTATPSLSVPTSQPSVAAESFEPVFQPAVADTVSESSSPVHDSSIIEALTSGTSETEIFVPLAEDSVRAKPQESSMLQQEWSETRALLQETIGLLTIQYGENEATQEVLSRMNSRLESIDQSIHRFRSEATFTQEID